ncbi:MAG TPA: hypothetical protein VJV03_12970 [Pyrinomonadaceae bacterium]|nr:hypothetical protein [Pyrinomonadaceae bacterium]
MLGIDEIQNSELRYKKCGMKVAIGSSGSRTITRNSELQVRVIMNHLPKTKFEVDIFRPLP